MLYTHGLKPILFRFDPERVHDAFVWIGESLGRHRLGRYAVHVVYGHREPGAAVTVDGIRYAAPYILSAGFDYNGRLSRILPHIGLGGEEIGSVTARPCAGNPRPRLARLPRSRSILVNKGLRNEGVDAVIERLKRTPRDHDFVLGISIARTNDERTADPEDGIADYLYSFRRLNEECVGDYYALNISCPNSFGGESFAEPALLDRLLTSLAAVPCSKPVYVKLPINLPWGKIDELVRIVLTHKLSGVIIGNLNKDYGAASDQQEVPAEYCGGLSGEPCSKVSTELIRMVRQTFGPRLTIIASGGVMSPEDARARFEAGADLIQIVTGLIFEGPGLVKKLVRSTTIRQSS